MSCFELKKRDLDKLIQLISRKTDVYAPVKKNGVTKFEKVSGSREVVLQEHSYLPLKRLFFKPLEILFDFHGSRMSVPKSKPRRKIILGAKRCDLNSILRQDMMFMNENSDVYYTRERENTLLIGYQCKSAFDKYCFCESMDLEECQDLMLFDHGPVFLVEVTSEKGRELIEEYKKFFTKTDKIPLTEEKVVKNANRLKNKNISQLYDNPVWKKGVELCISCGACNLLCPSCYCFSIEDKNDMNLKSGTRIRFHASCQLKSFTKVAGNHVFRESRDGRFKHRIYHQLQWFRDRHGLNLCTGCGRCIRFCPTRIDFVELISQMSKKEPGSFEGINI